MLISRFIPKISFEKLAAMHYPTIVSPFADQTTSRIVAIAIMSKMNRGKSLRGTNSLLLLH